MYRLDFNFAGGGGGSGSEDDYLEYPPAADSDYESDAESSDISYTAAWSNLDRRLLQRIASFLPRQSDKRTFCLVSKDWALAATPGLWAYPHFSAPQQLAAFLRTVTDRPNVYGPHIRGIRFTLSSHYDRHLVSPYYTDDDEASDAELPTLLEIAQGKHVLSTDPAILRSLLHGSDLSSPPLAFKFARACSPIDSLSIYGFRLRDKHIVNDLMRWRLRDIEIIGMPRKPLANLGFLLYNLRSLRSLRIESETPLPSDVWGPVALRLPALHCLRIWAPGIPGAQLTSMLSSAPKSLDILHLVGAGSDTGDDLVELVVNASPQIRSLVVHGSRITARSASIALCQAEELVRLELIRDEPELPALPLAVADAPPTAVASRLGTLSLGNLAIEDALIGAAAQVATQLRTLYISGAPSLGGAAVAGLLHASTELVALGLYDSPLLTDAALEGLASGPSASKLRVLLVRQCRMQSDGVERALPSFTSLKHFSVVGTEVVQQLFQYGYEDQPAQEPAEDDEAAPPSVVTRSFKPTYPQDHFFCKSDPEVAATSSEVARNIAEVTAAPPPQTPRTAWTRYSARRFVPGLLAFAGNNALGGTVRAGRRRATVSSEDTPAIGSDGAFTVPDEASGDALPPKQRLRSISEQPAGADPIIIHEGSDYAPSPQSEHSASFTPMERADPSNDTDEVTSRSLPAQDMGLGLAPAAITAAAGALAIGAIAAATQAESTAAPDSDDKEPGSESEVVDDADPKTRSVEGAIAEAVADQIPDPTKAVEETPDAVHEESDTQTAEVKNQDVPLDETPEPSVELLVPAGESVADEPVSVVAPSAGEEAKEPVAEDEAPVDEKPSDSGDATRDI
ncbi:hypothetical protein GGF46_003983, partial [Coemansia sp. RSA 552]